MKTTTIKQVASFPVPAAFLYALMLDEKMITRITGQKARIKNTIKGKLSIFDGYCKGYNIALITGKKIVQAWHFAEAGWPANHYSICTFLFENKGDKTTLHFTQEKVPGHTADSLKAGWKDFYWNPIKTWIQENGDTKKI